MDSIGQYLKSRRESLNLSVEDVANDTRLKDYIINQIERDDFVAIKDVGFIKVMVITYCRSINGDEDLVLKKLNKLFDKPTEPPIRINTVKNVKPVILPNNLIWFISLGVLIVVLTLSFVNLYQSGYSLHSFREQLASNEQRTLNPRDTTEVEPDHIWQNQRRVFDEIMTTEPVVDIIEIDEPHEPLPEYVAEIEKKPIIIDRRHILDKTDYIGQLLFDGIDSPINPRI